MPGQKRSGHPDQMFTLNHLSDAEWAEIKELAVILHDQGAFGANQFKCSIAAFTKWLGTKDFSFVIEAEEEVMH